MPTKFPCVVCSRPVRSNQHALQCDQCQEWQHRVCNTEFTRQQYLDLVSGEFDLLSWYCANCSIPRMSAVADTSNGSTLLSAVEHNAESTRLSSGIGGEEVEDEEMDVDDPMPSPQPHSLPLPPPTQSFDVSLGTI
ncbi:hypothetical protein Pmani_008793 [Petrolisthes manimaculis]|uniref:PHD-type domain-containing protein n=1 Tax=Petrolisthes manimaculis TaxID=1843537 RepID=A0AAE1UDH9_9EUCA|nr:hypothetical protein Pmani_008793 [Petrolisthes manimaculis]